MVFVLTCHGMTRNGIDVINSGTPFDNVIKRAWVGGILVCLALISCTTFNGPVALPPRVDGATFVGNQACYDCHTNITRAFPSSVHARLHFQASGLSELSGCESCHGPGSKHVAGGGGKGLFIVNPGRDPSACYDCHQEIHAEFLLPRHHPLPEGKMNCVACHDPHGLDIMKPSGGLAMGRMNESCAPCHRDQSRPFVYIHEALQEGCHSCHQPHGSMNQALLTYRDNNLCLRCHAQVANPAFNQLVIGWIPHSPRVMEGSCWSAGCHTAVHGSNIDPKLRY